jgi:hypothetical protein
MPAAGNIRRFLGDADIPPSLKESQTAFQNRNIHRIRQQASKTSWKPATFFACLMRATVSIRRFFPEASWWNPVTY